MGTREKQNLTFDAAETGGVRARSHTFACSRSPSRLMPAASPWPSVVPPTALQPPCVWHRLLSGGKPPSVGFPERHRPPTEDFSASSIWFGFLHCRFPLLSVHDTVFKLGIRTLMALGSLRRKTEEDSYTFRKIGLSNSKAVVIPATSGISGYLAQYWHPFSPAMPSPPAFWIAFRMAGEVCD